MASKTLIVFLACCACVAMASLPPAAAAAANGNRKMLGSMPDINVAIADAQARAAAAAGSFNQPTYVANNNDHEDKCKHGGCHDNEHHDEEEHPSYSACQSAAEAYASGSAISTGRGGFAFTKAKTFADARSASFGGNDWKNNFINACSSTAYAESTSIATSGK